MLISELVRALTETTDQAVANTCAAAEMGVHLRKELLEAKHRLTELEPAWEMFIAKHNDEEEAQESEQRRRAASERRHRRLENEATRVELQVAASIPPSEAAASTSHLATPHGADTDLSGAHDSGLASTLGMFSPAVSTGLESAREPGHSTATVDSDAARVTEVNRGIQSGRVQEHIRRARVLPRRHSCGEKSFSRTLCARPQHSLTSLKAYRNIFAHNKNAHAKISDWVSYIPVELYTQVRAHFVAMSIQKPTRNDSLRHKWTTGKVWMC